MNCLIRNANLINLSENKGYSRDILIENGQISAIGVNLSAADDIPVIDAEGCYATVGWIDAHAHLYTHPDAIGLNRDDFLSDGVTYMVEAGTAGAGNFEDYFRRSAYNKKMPGKAYLNLAYMGMLKPYGELKDLRAVNLEACERVIANYAQEIIGIKLRIDPRVCEDAAKAMELIRKLGDHTGLPIVVHASRTELPIEIILSYMKEGDIFAHSFADKLPGILDEQGKIKKAVFDARARGVQFDLSHGSGNFSFKVAEKAISQGFLPDAISTDLHSGSLKKVGSMGLTMSKMLSCGLTLYDVIRLVTKDAARMLRISKSEKETEIIIGKPADLVLFRVEEGNFVFEDSDGEQNKGKFMIHPYCTILGNDIYYGKKVTKN